MTSLWQKSLIYLGLVDEDQAEDGTIDGPRHVTPARAAGSAARPGNGGTNPQVSGRRVEPPQAARRTGEQPAVGHRSGAATGAVRPVRSADAQCEILEVTEFEHAKSLADRIRERTPVVLNLRETEPDMVRRIIDFSTGLTYALDGSMRKTAEGVILVLPPRVTIGREEKRRLSQLGFFDIDDQPS